MYYCRHNSSGLIWGQCCRKGSSSSHDCREMPDSADQTRCSDQSTLADGMKYYYCLVNKEQGLKSCGIENTDYNLLPDLVNKSIKIENLPVDLGNTCYYSLETNQSWDLESRVMIYPNNIKNMLVFLANGTSRQESAHHYSDVKSELSYSFYPGQKLYLTVAPTSADNSFEFSYSVDGKIAEK